MQGGFISKWKAPLAIVRILHLVFSYLEDGRGRIGYGDVGILGRVRPRIEVEGNNGAQHSAFSLIWKHGQASAGRKGPESEDKTPACHAYINLEPSFRNSIERWWLSAGAQYLRQRQ